MMFLYLSDGRGYRDIQENVASVEGKAELGRQGNEARQAGTMTKEERLISKQRLILATYTTSCNIIMVREFTWLKWLEDSSKYISESKEWIASPFSVYLILHQRNVHIYSRREHFLCHVCPWFSFKSTHGSFIWEAIYLKDLDCSYSQFGFSICRSKRQSLALQRFPGLSPDGLYIY